MPLIKRKSKDAFVSNLKAELAEGKSRDQSLAIAYAVKRKARAAGGSVFTGPIDSPVAGRTDHHGMEVASGSYVVPAHVVSGLGQGNTANGMQVLSAMFKPRGLKQQAPKLGFSKPNFRPKREIGGVASPAPEEETQEKIPILAAGGEYVISPESIVEKFGDLDRGHQELDKWVVAETKKLAKTVAKLPPPARD